MSLPVWLRPPFVRLLQLSARVPQVAPLLPPAALARATLLQLAPAMRLQQPMLLLPMQVRSCSQALHLRPFQARLLSFRQLLLVLQQPRLMLQPRQRQILRLPRRVLRRLRFLAFLSLQARRRRRPRTSTSCCSS